MRSCNRSFFAVLRLLASGKVASQPNLALRGFWENRCGRPMPSLVPITKEFFAIVVAVFVFIPTSSNALTIDDFSSGPLDVTLNETNQSFFEAQEGLPEESVVGRIRNHATVLNGPYVLGTEARIVVDDVVGTYRMSANASLETNVLRYGSGQDYALNLDLSSYGAFRIDVILSSIGIVRILLASGTDEIEYNGISDMIQASIPARDTPYTLILPFSGYGRDIDFSDIDFIKFEVGFNGTLDGIFVVPEPGTSLLVLLTLGVITNTRRRRRAALRH